MDQRSFAQNYFDTHPLQKGGMRVPQFNTPFGSPGTNFGTRPGGGGSPFSGFSNGFSTFPQGSGGGFASSAPLGFDVADDPAAPAQPPMGTSGGNIASRVLDWAKQNPKDALSMAGNVANSVMAYRQMAEQNRLQRAEEARRQGEYDRRRKNDESMSPARAAVLQALLQRLGGSPQR